MYLVLILIFIVVYFAPFGKKLIRNLYFSRQYTGPPAIPVLGNALSFANKTPAEIFETINQLNVEYGEIIRLWFGFDFNIFVADPKDVEFLLTSQVFITKSEDYRKLSAWLNSGLLLSTGKKWHQRRKIITPAFHFKILEQFVEVFERQSNIFINVLAKHCNGDQFELYPLVTLYALDVICETAMGTSVQAQKNSESAYVKAVKEEVHIIQLRTFDITLDNSLYFKFSSYGKRERDALKVLHNFTDDVIAKRREKLSRNLETDVDEKPIDDVGIKRKEALLDVLLKSTVNGKSLTDAEIREEVDTFMFEGHDTTTSAITFCLYNIAKVPAVQEKCIKEIIEVLGTDKDRLVSYSELNELNYLEKVIKETLRLYPSVPIIGRHIHEDVVINGRTYPAGSNVGINFYSMGRNPKYFKDPLEFCPERFDKENLNDINTFAYVPFSAGPRNCIGQKFALLEIKSVVSKVLRNYEIVLGENEELKLFSELILRPKTSLYFKLSPRIY